MDFQTTSAFLRIPYGIYILVTSQASSVQAMVVSWVAQISYSPSLLMVALRRNRPAVAAIREQEIFSLNLLKAEQSLLVNRIKRTVPTSEENTLFLEMQMGPRKFYRLKDCLAFWGCRLISSVEPGDHILFIAEVLTSSASEGKPLITSDCGMTYTGKI